MECRALLLCSLWCIADCWRQFLEGATDNINPSISVIMSSLMAVGIMSRHTGLSSPSLLHAAPTARRIRINQRPHRSTWIE